MAITIVEISYMLYCVKYSVFRKPTTFNYNAINTFFVFMHYYSYKNVLSVESVPVEIHPKICTRKTNTYFLYVYSMSILITCAISYFHLGSAAKIKKCL